MGKALPICITRRGTSLDIICTTGWEMTSLIETTVIAAPSILGAAVTLGLVITFLNLIYRLFSNASLPSTLPWAGVGEHNSSLGRAKANFTSFFDLKKLLDEGYVKVSLASPIKRFTPPTYILRQAKVLTAHTSTLRTTRHTSYPTSSTGHRWSSRHLRSHGF